MQIKLFERTNGKCPVYEYISNLNEEDQDKIDYKIEMLEKYGLQQLLRTEDVKKIEKKYKIYELRPYGYRITFTKVDDIYWLLHGFSKKTNKTPKKEIDKAINIKKQLLEQLQ